MFSFISACSHGYCASPNVKLSGCERIALLTDLALIAICLGVTAYACYEIYGTGIGCFASCGTTLGMGLIAGSILLSLLTLSTFCARMRKTEVRTKQVPNKPVPEKIPEKPKAKEGNKDDLPTPLKRFSGSVLEVGYRRKRDPDKSLSANMADWKSQIENINRTTLGLTETSVSPPIKSKSALKEEIKSFMDEISVLLKATTKEARKQAMVKLTGYNDPVFAGLFSQAKKYHDLLKQVEDNLFEQTTLWPKEVVEGINKLLEEWMPALQKLAKDYKLEQDHYWLFDNSVTPLVSPSSSASSTPMSTVEKDQVPKEVNRKLEFNG